MLILFFVLSILYWYNDKIFKKDHDDVKIIYSQEPVANSDDTSDSEKTIDEKSDITLKNKKKTKKKVIKSNPKYDYIDEETSNNKILEIDLESNNSLENISLGSFDNISNDSKNSKQSNDSSDTDSMHNSIM